MNPQSRGLLLSMHLANAETGFADFILKGDLLTQFFGPFSAHLPSNVYTLYACACVPIIVIPSLSADE